MFVFRPDIASCDLANVQESKIFMQWKSSGFFKIMFTGWKLLSSGKENVKKYRDDTVRVTEGTRETQRGVETRRQHALLRTCGQRRMLLCDYGLKYQLLYLLIAVFCCDFSKGFYGEGNKIIRKSILCHGIIHARILIICAYMHIHTKNVYN